MEGSKALPMMELWRRRMDARRGCTVDVSPCCPGLTGAGGSVRCACGGEGEKRGWYEGVGRSRDGGAEGGGKCTRVCASHLQLLRRRGGLARGDVRSNLVELREHAVL